jgi:pimeloyl-ACP methyl ester carboxylesterase
MNQFTEGVIRSPRHTSFYLSSGPADGTPIIFLHGWPELSLSWRGQLPVFGSMGFRAIAPDMRGYGRSSVPADPSAYALEEIVGDVRDLLDHLDIRAAVFVGHDWGAPVVWSMAQHHPERCLAVANLCVPYLPEGFAPANLISLSDRTIYPWDEHPAAQWDYQLFYEDDLEGASAAWEKNVRATVRTLFRAGSPADVGKPAFTAGVRARGGFFGPGGGAPDVPRDDAVISAAEESAYVAALTRNGFKGPDSWYVNAQRNIAFAEKARERWRLDMPVLFLHAAYDPICETLKSRLAQPMREWCDDLEEEVVASGHWMAQEKPGEVNAALCQWLARKAAAQWRVSPRPGASAVARAGSAT